MHKLTWLRFQATDLKSLNGIVNGRSSLIGLSLNTLLLTTVNNELLGLHQVTYLRLQRVSVFFLM